MDTPNGFFDVVSRIISSLLSSKGLDLELSLTLNKERLKKNFEYSINIILIL
jgi:hypothetical protein